SEKIGYRLKTAGREGPTLVHEYGRAHDFLYLMTSSLKKPVQLVEVPVEKVLAVEKDATWVITAGLDRKLFRISGAGGIDEIMKVDEQWVAALMRHRFSPARRYLALTFLHGEHDFHAERGLVVVDLRGKRIVHANKCIRFVDASDSAAPSLDIAWLDETRLW